MNSSQKKKEESKYYSIVCERVVRKEKRQKIQTNLSMNRCSLVGQIFEMIIIGLGFNWILQGFSRFAVLCTLFNAYGLLYVDGRIHLAGQQYEWPFLKRGDSLLGDYCSVYFAIECIFFVYLCVLKYGVFNFTPAPLPVNNATFPRARRRLLFERMIDFLKRVGIDEGKLWLQGWFFGAKYSELGGENLIEFLAFAYFKIKDLKDVTLEHRLELVEYRKTLYSFFGALPNEYRENIPCMKNSVDSILPNVKDHPLVLYAVVRIFLGIFCSRAMLWYYGFRKYEGDLNYTCYVKKPSVHGSGASVPLLFFHGIGIGWFPYVKWIQRFSTYESRTVIVIEQSNVAVEFPNPFMPCSMNDMCAATQKILSNPEYLGIAGNPGDDQKIDLLGHSYGTCPVAWIIRYFPHNVRLVTLVDPVCMQLYRSDVCHRFLYSPSALNMVDAFLSHLLQDVGVTRTLMRSFDWFNNTLFLEEVEHLDVEVILSENDHFTPSRGIAAEIDKWSRSKIGVQTLPKFAHGQSIFDDAGVSAVLRCVERTSLPMPRRSARIRKKPVK